MGGGSSVVVALRATVQARRTKYNQDEELGQVMTNIFIVLPLRCTESNGSNETAEWNAEFCRMRATGDEVDLCLPSTGSQLVLLTGQTDRCAAQNSTPVVTVLIVIQPSLCGKDGKWLEILIRGSDHKGDLPGK